MSEPCNTFWGGHGCDLNEGHSGVHRCGNWPEPCSQFDGTDRSARYWHDDEAEWSKWMYLGTTL